RGQQLFSTNERVGNVETGLSTAQSDITAVQGDVTTAQTDISTLQGQVGGLGTSISTGSVTADSLNVGSGVLAADSAGVTVGADVNMGGNKITNLANGAINATSTDAVTGQQVHNLFIETGATGVRYF